jgi:hypothetical protein
MEDKTSSTEIEAVLLSQPQENSTEISQSSLAVQVTEVTCLRKRLSEVKRANRAKAAQNLRAIAHLLMSGALGFLFVFFPV